MNKKVFVGWVHPKYTPKWSKFLSNGYKVLIETKNVWNKKLGVNYKKIRITFEEVK